MDLGLSSKRAAVAAASAGLGYAVASALIDEGAHVAICGHDQDRVRAATKRLGDRCVPLTVDVSKPDGAEEFVRAAQSALGGVDILVANAPGPPAHTFATAPVAAYQDALELNLLSVVRMCHAAVPAMRERAWGRIVAITSISVRQPIPNLILSTTARAGVTGFLKSLAREIAADGVTVNSVQPGLHATDRVRAVYADGLDEALADIPAGVLGQPDDFGAAVAFLCSEQARYITGCAIPIDGGSDRGLQ